MLKKLFGFGNKTPRDRGIYIYIRIAASGEIVQLRLTPGYDMSKGDDGQMFSRKLVMGRRSRSFEKAEALLYFDKNYNLMDSEITGGEVVSKEEYDAQEATLTES